MAEPLKEYRVKRIPMRDTDTGVEYARYEYERGDAQVFYYHSEALTADKRFLPHWSTVSGAWQIHVLDREREVSLQLSRNAEFLADGPAHDIRRHRVYRIEDRRLCWTDYRTGETRWVYQLPERWWFSHITVNEDFFVLAVHEDVTAGSVPDGAGVRPLARTPPACTCPRSLLVGGGLDSDKAEAVWGDTSFLTHAVLTRGNNDWVVYADQSARRLHMELFAIMRPLVNDKKPRRIFRAAPGGMNYVGHGFVTLDGHVACQMREFLGVDAVHTYTDKCSYHAVARVDGTGYRRARFPGREKPIHSHGQRIDNLWVADAWIRPDGTMDMDWLSVIRNRWECMDMEIRPFIRTNHHHRRPFHVHPWIAPDESEIVYSAAHEGRNHLFVAAVPASFQSRNWAPLPPHLAPGRAYSSSDDGSNRAIRRSDEPRRDQP